jgi:hypothetical protein
MTKAGWDDSVAPIAAAKRWLKTSREEPGSWHSRSWEATKSHRQETAKSRHCEPSHWKSSRELPRVKSWGSWHQTLKDCNRSCWRQGCWHPKPRAVSLWSEHLKLFISGFESLEPYIVVLKV